MTMQHHPGDIVNGHQLNEDGTSWVPVAGAPAPAPAEKENWVKRHKVLTGIGALALIGVVATVAGGGSDSPTTDSASGSDTTVEAPANTSEQVSNDDAVAGIGTPVSDGKFEFVVTDVKTGVAEVGEECFNETAQGSYTLVTMTVTNTGDVPQTFYVDNVEGTDSQDRELAADSMASLYATPNGSDLWLTEINPGNSITVTVAFDVASGESLTSVDVHDSAFPCGETIKLS